MLTVEIMHTKAGSGIGTEDIQTGVATASICPATLLPLDRKMQPFNN